MYFYVHARTQCWLLAVSSRYKSEIGNHTWATDTFAALSDSFMQQFSAVSEQHLVPKTNQSLPRELERKSLLFRFKDLLPVSQGANQFPQQKIMATGSDISP